MQIADININQTLTEKSNKYVQIICMNLFKIGSVQIVHQVEIRLQLTNLVIIMGPISGIVLRSVVPKGGDPLD